MTAAKHESRPQQNKPTAGLKRKPSRSRNRTSYLRRLLPRDASASFAALDFEPVAAAAEARGDRARLLFLALAASGASVVLGTPRVAALFLAEDAGILAEVDLVAAAAL